MAAAVGAEIAAATHKGAGPLDDFGDAREQVGGGDRLGEEFGDAGIARRFDPVLFGMAA